MDRANASEPVARGSYIMRHWRGELSLPVSFWINVQLVSLLFGFLLVIPIGHYITYAPRLFSLGAIAFLLSGIVISVWQVVGAWRSARARAASGRRFWARLAQVSLVIGVVGSGYTVMTTAVPSMAMFASVVLGIDEFGDYEITVDARSGHLVIEGGIGFGLSDAVAEALRKSQDIHTIELWSDGGRLVEARRLAEIVRERGLNTLVIDRCVSACTQVFMAGKRRMIARDASLGFHNGWFPGASEAEARAMQIADRQYLLRRGVSPEFVSRIYRTPSTELWVPSHAELFHARVVTDYATATD
jgi:hypothetical protein